MIHISKQLQRFIAVCVGLLIVICIASVSLPSLAYAAEQTGDPAAVAAQNGQCVGVDCVTKYLNPFIKLLSALVGIVVTVSIIYAGIQYSSARDESGKVEAAKKRIGNAIVALIAWILMLTFLQWLLPGGIV